MEGVQAGGHLHRLHLINGLAGSVEGTAQVEWGTAIGVVVFNDEILHFLGVHERSREGMFLCLDVVIVLKAILSQHLLYFLMRTRGNLVNH